MERTLILAKPDAYARGLTGEILTRFERKGLVPVALRVLTMTRELAERHYAEHLEKPFFGELADFITSGPLVAMVLEGSDAVAAARQVIGATNPLNAAPGSIRGDLAIATGENLVTAPTVPSRPCGRSGSSSRVVRLVLASRSPQRRAILRGLGVRFTVRQPGFDETEQGESAAGRARKRAGEGAVGRASRRRGRARRGHDRRARRAHLRKARARSAGACHARGALRCDAHRLQRRRARGAERGAPDGGRSDGRDLPCVGSGGRSTPTSPPASGRVAPAATRSRARGRRSCSRSTATTRTWSGCRSRRCWRCGRRCRAGATSLVSAPRSHSFAALMRSTPRGPTLSAAARPLELGSEAGSILPSRRQSASEGRRGTSAPTPHRWVSSAI